MFSTLSASSLDSKQTFQGKVYFAKCYSGLGTKFEQEVNKRLARWRIPSVYLKCIRIILILHSCGCPQRIFNALATSWLNAWVTKRRSQSLASSCPYCTQWLSSSSIEHFACCKEFVGFANHFLKLPRETSLALFLVLVEDHPNIVCKRALHLYLCKITFDSGRHGNPALAYLVYRANLIKFVTKFPRFVTNIQT